MKRALSYVASIIGLVIGSLAGTAFAQTTANGPYYATPSWDQKLPASTRFIVLSNWNNEAVLDRETGLVWEKTPSNNPFYWAYQTYTCSHLDKGGRLGWRLPTIQELGTLIDSTVPFQSGAQLPIGHPFTGVDPGRYWSATSSNNAGLAFWMKLSINPADGDDKRVDNSLKSANYPRWCVRGGSGVDPQ